MNKRQIKAAVSSAILGILSPLAMVVPASAATVTWDGSTDNKFNTGTNWSTDSIPTASDDAVFSADTFLGYESQTVGTLDNDISSLSLVKIIFNGEVTLSSKSYNLGGNQITLTGGIDAVMTGTGGDHQVNTDVTLGASQTFKTTGSNSIQIGTSSSTLDLDTYDLTLDASGGTITLLGSIEGSGDIIKSGDGKVKLMTDAGSGYTGSLSIPEGETSVDNNLGLPVTLSGGTLKGTGTVGAVTMSSGAVAPGNSPGILNTGNLVYTGGAFDVELGGTAAGEFDQTNVTGTVDLGTATDLNISLFGSYAPAINDAFVIINNDGTDAVVGNFNGLENGDKVIGTYTYQINYDAGDGNDVVLLVTGNPAAPDTGVASLIANPLVTVGSALAVLAVVGAVRFAELKKARN